MNSSNHYYCTVYAARLMAPRKQGLIVVVSSIGGLRYLFNVAYGVGKAAVSVTLSHYFHSNRNSSVIVWLLTLEPN